MPDQRALELAYSKMGYSGPMPRPRAPRQLRPGPALEPTAVEPADPPALGPDQLAQLEELLEIDPEETVNRLRSAWDPNLTEDQLRAVIANARALVERPERFLPVLEATAALESLSGGLPEEFTFPGMDLGTIPINPDDHKFEEVGDSLGWVAFAAFPALFPAPKANFPLAESFGSRFEYRLPEPSADHPLDIAVFADFGTGRYHSLYIAKQLGERALPMALHLGDVYYAGRQSEFAKFFAAPLDPILPKTELFMLNSNHEMFSGGKWYFDFVERKRLEHSNQRQEGSYFSLVSERFQIVGIDTDYHKNFRFPKTDLQDWLRAKLSEGRAAGRINILLSGDQPYEYGKNAFTQLFTKDLFDLSTNGLIDLWFWGNTHYCGLFDRSVTAGFIGSCVGHGGFPYTKLKKGEFSVVPIRFVETRARFPQWTKLRQDMGNNGYCQMSLHADGKITLQYFDWMSTLRCTAELGRPAAGARWQYFQRSSTRSDMYTIERTPLATDWTGRLPGGYDVIVIGSGYGGAITGARLANAEWPATKPSACILERGKEWLPGQFPDTLAAGSGALRNNLNPLGLYDFRFGANIGAWMASGLGGTSLINANVAIEPDDEVFDDPKWPQAIRDARDSGLLNTLFSRVRSTLHAGPHPHGNELSKVRVLEQGAVGVAGAEFDLCNIAVNFEFEGNNAFGVRQRRCINCGDCITGCNVGAKNTLDTNYLALAKSGGAHIFTQVEVRHIQKFADGTYAVHYTRRDGAGAEDGSLLARRVIVSAGALGSTAIMLRSRLNGLDLPDAVGTRFSGNGDFLALAYNSDHPTNMLGWGAYPESDRAHRIQPGPGPTLHPGPTIVARIKYNTDKSLAERTTFEDLSLPLIYVDAARATFAAFGGIDTDPGDFSDNLREFGRRARDFGGFDPRLEEGALNYTLMYLIMGHDDAGGVVKLDALTGEATIDWPGVGNQQVFANETAIAQRHAGVLGATFITNPLWAFSPFHTLLTPHPLGGCPMGETHATGLVNDVGQVFDGHGGLHDGLYIADGSIIPTAIGVNPFLTISALTERIAGALIVNLGGVPSP